MKVLVLHGVNLNMFGKRDIAHYGPTTLAEINAALEELAARLGIELVIYQTNHEGDMVERIHKAVGADYGGVLLNAGAWTHYSYAIADALAMLTVPIVEVHMSRVFAREEFRRRSVFADIVCGTIAGFGTGSYLLGLRAIYQMRAQKYL